MADIIVIDDDPRYRRLIAQALTGAGHEVRQAGDGAEGLAMCLQRTPEMVITDIVMPGMEGIETILQLARQRPGVAVLAISGAEPALGLFARRHRARRGRLAVQTVHDRPAADDRRGLLAADQGSRRRQSNSRAFAAGCRPAGQGWQLSAAEHASRRGTSVNPAALP